MNSTNSEPADPVASPCRRQCCLNDQDTCLGCGRTLQEILAWGKADQDSKRSICRAAEARLRRMAGQP